MKKTLLTLFVSILSITALHQTSNAQSILVHYWNFNAFTGSYTITPSTPTIPGIPADYTRIGAASPEVYYAELPGTSSAFSTYLDYYTVDSATDYDTVNAQLGAAEGNAIRCRNPSDSMQLLFYMPTTNYCHIQLAYGSEKSSDGHGMAFQIYHYSTDSGVTWKTSGIQFQVSGYVNDSTDSATTAFTRIQIYFNDPAVNNNPKFVFQVTFDSNTALTVGNNRFDNISMMADSITVLSTPNTITHNFENATTLSPNPATDYIDLSQTTVSDRYITIYDAVGNTVYAAMNGSKNYRLDISKFVPGAYYIRLIPVVGGQAQTLKFIKE